MVLNGAEHFGDPKNGFEKIYEQRTNRLLYTAVRVPPGIAFWMEYERFVSETHLTFAPVRGDHSLWRVQAVVDTNNYRDLGLPIARDRRSGLINPTEDLGEERDEEARLASLYQMASREGEGENGPTITEGNLVAARKFGRVDEQGEGKLAGTQLFDIDLRLPADNIRKFLERVWQPDLVLSPDGGSLIETDIPKIVVGDNTEQERILPQKYQIRPSKIPMARLVVFRG